MPASAKDTISAIATPSGHGGIAIIRMSGPLSLEILRRIFKQASLSPAARGVSPLEARYRRASGASRDDIDQPQAAFAEPESHKLYHGYIVDSNPRDGAVSESRGTTSAEAVSAEAVSAEAVIDEVLAVLMKAPNSYTGEDIVEIYCHGGSYLSGRILKMTLDCGARPAEPGEFTKRAVLSGRMDLSQAEAVLDIINAETDGELKNASMILGGKLKAIITEITDALTHALVEIEARLDFSDEEELGEIPLDNLKESLGKAHSSLHDLEVTYADGKRLKQQDRVIICGKTNVGKSSILNRLAGEDRAIVSEHPLTTRDAVETSAIIKGRTYTVVDTAGFADEPSSGPDEIALKKARELISNAAVGAGFKPALLLVILDASHKSLTEEDMAVLKLTRDARRIIAFNKIDLIPVGAQHAVPLPGIGLDLDDDVVRVSALTGEGFNELEAAIHEMHPVREEKAGESLLLTSARHHREVAFALEALKRAMDCLETSEPPELVALELGLASEALGRITGQDLTGDVLDTIFEKFCIGK